MIATGTVISITVHQIPRGNHALKRLYAAVWYHSGASPVMGSFRNISSRRDDGSSIQRIEAVSLECLVISIVIMFNLSTLVATLVLKIPISAAPETCRSGYRQVVLRGFSIEESNSLNMARAHKLRLRLRMRYLIFSFFISCLI